MSWKGLFVSFPGNLSVCRTLCIVFANASGLSPHFCFGTAFGSFFLPCAALITELDLQSTENS